MPYADDFLLMTTNLKTHQRIMNRINSQVESMGMRLKPSKCRTFSLKSGKPSQVVFQLDGTRIPTIFEEDQKYLGKLVFPMGKSEETFQLFHATFLEKLENIDSIKNRNEHKLWIYKNYFLPSQRFLLTVHEITSTDLKKLDNLTNKYLRKWAGMPPCTTSAIIHLRTGLDIKSISSLYEEAHCVSHARTRLLGDSLVNHALNSKINREVHQIRKKSVTVTAEKDYEQAMRLNTVGGDRPMFGELWQREESEFNDSIREEVKLMCHIRKETSHIEHVNTLVKQGDFLKLAENEKGDAVWKSYIFDMKKGVMKFCLNSITHTLPSGDNLLQWGKATSDKCKACKGRETTCHILNNCPVYLEQGRYTWRHDNVINYILNCLDNTKFEFYSDLDGRTTATGGTIPVTVCITPLKPDITIIDKKTKTFNIFELTCPMEPNIKKRNSDKFAKYSHFLTDISCYTPTLTCFEIGSRGYVSPDNQTRLKTIHSFCKPGIKLKKFKENISALSLYSSYAIFVNRKETQWMNPGFLEPPFMDK